VANAYLDELQQSMFEISGHWVTEATILAHSGMVRIHTKDGILLFILSDSLDI
jgi:hypothetical protein